jgi:predicted membrane-bound spermidine synthase
LAQLAISGQLGVAFMLLEVILVERASLLLGHPTVAFVVVVTSMLCGLGTGSVLSGRLRPEQDMRRAATLAFVVLVCVAALTSLAVLASPLRALPSALRPWVAAIPLFVGAVPLGMLLPSVVRAAIATEAAAPAGCWTVNAACSVLGTLGAALLVRTVGFSATGRLACLLYGGAVVLFFLQARRAAAIHSRQEPSAVATSAADESFQGASSSRAR